MKPLALLVGPDTDERGRIAVARPAGAVTAVSANADEVLDAIDELTAREGRPRFGRRATADVADIWL